MLGNHRIEQRPGTESSDVFGRLWEMWRSPAGERVRSFATITTKSNELCAELHDRMPVIVALKHSRNGWGRSHPVWSRSKRCSRQFPSEEITCWPVSTRVGNVRNNDPNLIDPIAAE